MKKVFMFDVESDGLLGEGFAVGGVFAKIDNGNVEVVKEFAMLSELDNVKDEWVKENVIPNINASDFTVFKSRQEMRKEFHNLLQDAKENGYEIWADCVWPVEANFLIQVVKESGDMFSGPYPLKDLATILDINISREEFSGLKYTHNPLDDAKASLFSLAKI